MKRVLVVDDSKISRQFNKKILEELGYTVVAEAVDGLDGVEKFYEVSPDVIVTDLEMPKLDGVGMLQKLRESGSDVKVIVVTSLVNSQVIQKVMKQNATIVRKPIKKEKFERALTSLNG